MAHVVLLCFSVISTKKQMVYNSLVYSQVTSSCSKSISSATIQSYHLKVYWPSNCYSNLEFFIPKYLDICHLLYSCKKHYLLQQIEHSSTYITYIASITL